jgi:hypothetical protein
VIWPWVQGTWNLRLALGRQLADEPVRSIVWAPLQTAASTPLAVPTDQPAEEYSPWQWARGWGRAAGRLGAEVQAHGAESPRRSSGG